MASFVYYIATIVFFWGGGIIITSIIVLNFWAETDFTVLADTFSPAIFYFWFSLLCKHLSLIGPHLFIFVLTLITLGGESKKILQWCRSKSIVPMFLMEFYSIWSLIHFELTFVHGAREYSNFIILHVTVQFSQHHLLKRLSFLHCIWLLPSS